MKHWATQITAAVYLLLREGERRRKKASGGRPKRRKKRKKTRLDPEIIAHAKSYLVCGSSGGQTVVYGLSVRE